jgi:hypothetical protein
VSKNNLKQIGTRCTAIMTRWAPPVAGAASRVKHKTPIHLTVGESQLPVHQTGEFWKLFPNNGQGELPKQVKEVVIKLYLSPLDKDRKPQTHCRVFVGNGAAFEWGQGLKMAQFPDGLSNTILAVECADPIDWTSIDEFKYDPKKPLPKLGGIFPGGFHALMGDGDVKWIPADTDEKTIRALITQWR